MGRAIEASVLGLFVIICAFIVIPKIMSEMSKLKNPPPDPAQLEKLRLLEPIDQDKTKAENK